jgi:hypothetical protein
MELTVVDEFHMLNWEDEVNYIDLCTFHLALVPIPAGFLCYETVGSIITTIT